MTRYTVDTSEGRDVRWVVEGHEWRLHGHREAGRPVVEVMRDGEVLPTLSASEVLAAREALDLLLASREHAPPRRTPRVGLPPGAGRVWTTEDDQTLREGWNDGLPIDDLATALSRTSGAIEARVVRLGLAPDRETARRVVRPAPPPEGERS